ncbi:hypothetical protein AALO_G00021920 [Alosa alosa]|uniref:Uncharacterized protein n=1 Tax=Alosa alosa TaxID=278164 RepID=A0AAV6HEQ7_9TELE|nr:hypothetical protein AALO_G00021920 [Alosa alosa]
MYQFKFHFTASYAPARSRKSINLSRPTPNCTIVNVWVLQASFDIVEMDECRLLLLPLAFFSRVYSFHCLATSAMFNGVETMDTVNSHGHVPLELSPSFALITTLDSQPHRSERRHTPW